MTKPLRVAVIGGGLSGLSAAIRLAEQDVSCDLFEAAPSAGGRTRSFFEPTMQQQCDNGPHLLLGAYTATKKLLQQCGAEQSIHWQSSLSLPLWDNKRGHFAFQPGSKLPFAIAMLFAAAGIPGHGSDSATAMLRLAIALQRKKPPQAEHVTQWFEQLRIPERLIRDLLEPLCLGAMNEAMHTACPVSFKRVLQESFANRSQASLGWFRGPLQTTLIEPLIKRAEALGVNIHTRCRIRQLQPDGEQIKLYDRLYDKVIIALPAYATDRLLHRTSICETRPITNIHLWLESGFTLPSPLIGCIGGMGQWYFDISQQWHQESPSSHICAVISADDSNLPAAVMIQRCMDELRALHGLAQPPELIHSRIVREQRATVLVRAANPDHTLPRNIIDASERPAPGELPATIESAVRRGENAAHACISGLDYHCYPL
ncbi:MAG: FAD-dependent oxidoreductase [Mariprofundus sp.]